MTKTIKASEIGLKPHFKVRVVIPGALLHIASWDLPRVELAAGGWIHWVDAEWIDNPAYGDTIGHIHWREVKAITWRWSA